MKIIYFHKFMVHKKHKLSQIIGLEQQLFILFNYAHISRDVAGHHSLVTL